MARSRWQLLHLLWGVPGALTLLLLALLASPFLLGRQASIRDWGLDRLDLEAVFASPTRARIDRVERFDPSGFSVTGVRLESRGDGGWVPWLVARRVDLRLRPEDLLTRRVHLSLFRIDSLAVDLTAAPSPLSPPGGPAAGEGGGAEKPGGVLRLPRLRCALFQVNQVQVVLPDGRRLGADVALEGIAHQRGEIRGTLRRVLVRTEPDSLWLALENGLIEVSQFRQYTLSAAGLSGPGLAGRVDADWNSGAAAADSSARLIGEIAVSRLVPGEIPLVRDWPVPLEEDDQLAGHVVFHLVTERGAPPRAELGLDLDGSLFGTGLDTLLVAMRASPGRADLENLRLRFGPMSVHGSAMIESPGQGSASVELAGIDLAVPPVSRFAAGLPSSDLNGVIRVEADSIGPRLHLQAVAELDPGVLLGRPLSGLSIRMELDPGEVRLDRLETEEVIDGQPTVRLHGRASRDLEEITAQATLHRFPLQSWIEPWLTGVTLEGAVSGEARVWGSRSRLEVEGDLGVRDGRAMEVYLDTLRLSRIAGRVLPLALSADLDGSGIDAYEVPLDSVRGWVAVGDTIRTRLSASMDTLSCDLAARILPYARGALLLDSCAVRPGRAPELRLDTPARLNWSPELVWIDSIRVRSEFGRAGGRGWIRPSHGAPGGDSMGFAARAENLELASILAFFGLPADAIRGTGRASLTGSGRVERPVYAFEGEATGLETLDWYWDRLTLAGAAGEGIGLWIDSLRVIGQGYHGILPGVDLVGPQMPGPPVVVRGDSLSVTIPGTWKETLDALADSARAADVLGRAGISGRIRIDDAPVAPFLMPYFGPRRDGGSPLATPLDPMRARIVEERPEVAAEERRRPSGIGGSVSLEARVKGDVNDLAVDLDLSGNDLWIYQAWADSVRFRATVGDGSVDLRTFDWHMGPTRLHGEGQAGWRLGLVPPYAREVRGESTRVVMELKEADLALVSLVTGVLQDPAGTLSGRIVAEGIGRQVHPRGEFTVHDGSFRVPGREERFSRIEGEGHIDSAGLHLVAQGRLNESGRVDVSGLARSLEEFDLRAQVREAPVFERGNYRMLVEGDLRAAPIVEGDSIRPRLSGTARVLEGLITQDLSKPPALRQPPYTPWLIEIQVDAPGNFRVNQPYAAVDLGEGALTVSYRWPWWSLWGTVEVLGGRYRIFNRSLRITSGTVTFHETGKGPDPEFDIQAETEIPGSGDEPPVQVELHVTGHPARKELQVDLSSPDPRGYSSDQLVELLSVGQLSNPELGTFSASDPTRQAISSELIEQIEQNLVRQLPWIDRVQLEGEFGGQDPMRINFRPIVQPQWSVVYAQELGASPDREVSLRYRLSNLLFLNAAVDREKGENNLMRDTYSLDLKLRIEY